MYFHTLGGVTATQDGDELALGGPKQRLVLALLLCSPGRLVPTDRLVDSVWHDAPPSDPRGALQVYVSNLRRLLDGVEFEHRGEGYVLHVGSEQVDMARFEELVDKGTALVASDPGRAATVLRDALALWRGRPFGGLGDEPALAVETARLEELRLRALEARLDADLQLGRHDDVVGELAELTSQHPMRERFWAQLVLARYRSGRQAEALSAYESARETLTERLGIDPSPFLQQLHTQVLRQDPAIAAPASPPASEPDDPTVRVGAVRGYELHDELGSGRLGVVFRGRQPSVEREVAIKVIRAELANDPEFVRCFETEAQRVAQLEHPHIVPLYDYWREPDAAYVVMRWLRGGNLSDTLREGGWSLEAAVGLLEQIAAALDYGHRHGVLHLAVKPTNILLDLDSNAYLSDFGLARYAQDPPAGAPPAYVSPERRAGQPPTAATDLFALGLVTFELLTGRQPRVEEPSDTQRDGAHPHPLPPLRVHRPDLPDGVEAILRQSTAADPRQRFHTASEMAQALRGEIGPVAAGAPPTRVVRNPYKGLQAFGEADSGDFFGREQLVAHLLERLDGAGQRSRVMTVVGPSGSGKSSLVRAGLVPALRRGGARGSERWFVAMMRPGPQPLAELERALAEVATCDREELAEALGSGDEGLTRAVERALPADGSELLLVVDQFEELFSLAAGEQRRQFAGHLRHVATQGDSRVRVALTIRADFYDHPLLDPDLGEIVAATTLAVPALSAEELERAIAGPAAAVGVRPHPELITQITSDVANTPAALPLLQYALTELFDRRSGDALTLEGYRAIGGVQGALAGRAEQLYASLDPAAQEACRQLCLRLVTVTDRGTGIRRRVRRDELAGFTTDDTIDHVIETFGRHRLLTFDRDPITRAPTVEVAHEALLDAWERLRGWIEQAHTDLRMQQRLAAALDEWAASDYDEAYLLHGSRLEEFDEWARHCQVALTEPERQLLEVSRAAEAARQEHEQARRERERRLERRAINRLRAVAVISVVAALGAVALSGFAFYQRHEADQQQRLATARELATAAIAALDDDPELSILLGREAVRVTQEADGTVTPDVETALRRAITASRVRQRLSGGGALSVAPDGRLATLATDGTLTIRDPLGDGNALELEGYASGDPDAPPGFGEAIDFSSDGTAVVAADTNQRGVVSDAATGEVQTRLEGELTRPRFGRDGELVAGILLGPSGPDDDPSGPSGASLGAGDTVGVWDVTTGQRLQRLDGDTAMAHAFSPDGAHLVTQGSAGVRMWVRSWDVATGEVEWSVPTGEHHDQPRSLAFDPDGDRIAVGSGDGPVRLLDADDGEQLATFTGHTAPVRAVSFSGDGERLVTASRQNARVWEIEGREERFVLRGRPASLTDAAFTPDGDRVVTTSEDDTTRIWDISVDGGFEHAALPTREDAVVAFSPDDRHIAVSGAEDAVHLRDLDTLETQQTLPVEQPPDTLAYSGDGETVAAIVSQLSPRNPRERIHVWNLSSGEHQMREGALFDRVRDLALSHDGSRLAMVGEQGSLRLVDVDTGQELVDHAFEDGPLSDVAFTRGDERLVVSAEHSVAVSDATTGERLRDLDDLEGPVADVADVGDDRVVVGEGDGSIGLFDLDTGERIRTVARASGVRSLDVREGKLAVARSASVSLRDLDTDEGFDLSYGHEVSRVRLSPGGRYLATALLEPRVHLHVVRTDDLLDLAAERLTRSLTDEECDEYLDRPCPDES